MSIMNDDLKAQRNGCSIPNREDAGSSPAEVTERPSWVNWRQASESLCVECKLPVGPPVGDRSAGSYHQTLHDCPAGHRYVATHGPDPLLNIRPIYACGKCGKQLPFPLPDATGWTCDAEVDGKYCGGLPTAVGERPMTAWEAASLKAERIRAGGEWNASPTDAFKGLPRPPHCDPRVLHAPEACEYCRRATELQEERVRLDISNTGCSNRKYVCPADLARPVGQPGAHDRWGGNVAVPDHEYAATALRHEPDPEGEEP